VKTRMCGRMKRELTAGRLAELMGRLLGRLEHMWECVKVDPPDGRVAFQTAQVKKVDRSSGSVGG
jgi:hypothetical protein